jgi:D-alanyl-D-alanine carboxypeptidase
LLRFSDLNLATIHLETLEAVPAQAGERMAQYFGDCDVSVLDASIDLYGGGGLVSDVRDLCGFWRCLFEGRVFDLRATLERMCVTMPGPDRDVAIGLGVFRHRFGDYDVWLHTGFWGTIALHECETHITIAAATNQAASHLPHEALLELGRRLFDLALKA